MKKANIFLAALLAATMTGCVDVPEDVKSRHEANNSVNADADKLKEDHKTIPLSEMRAALPEKIKELKALKLDNMTFSEYLDVDIPEKLKTGQFIVPEDYGDDYLELFRHYDSEFDEKNTYVEEKYTNPGLSYTNPDTGLYIQVNSCGYFLYYTEEKDRFLEYTSKAKSIKYYTAAEARNSKDAYKLIHTDKEIPVSEALEKAQAFADDLTEFRGYPNKPTAVAIFLKECDEGYFYEVKFTESLSGVNTFEMVSHTTELEDGIRFPNTGAVIVDEDVTNFWIFYAYKEHEITGEIDSAVDVVDAARYVSGTLSWYMNLEVKRIALEYCMISDGNLKGDDYSIETEGALNLIKVVPCYVFYINETYDEEKLVRLRCDDMSVVYLDCKVNMPAG